MSKRLTPGSKKLTPGSQKAEVPGSKKTTPASQKAEAPGSKKSTPGSQKADGRTSPGSKKSTPGSQTQKVEERGVSPGSKKSTPGSQKVEKVEDRMTQEEFAMLGKPWIKPFKGMKVVLSSLCPKFLRELTESNPKQKGRVGRVTDVHTNPLDGGVWVDVAWDGIGDFPPEFRTGYQCGRFGNFHLVLKDVRTLQTIRDDLDKTLPDDERGKLPLRIMDSTVNFARPPTVGSSGMHTTETLDRLRTPHRMFHAAQTVEWGLDPQGDAKTKTRMNIETRFWEKNSKEEMDRMKEEGSAGAAQGRQRNRPKTMPERMKQGMYSIGGQIEVKDRARANEMAKKGGTHLTHESLRQI